MKHTLTEIIKNTTAKLSYVCAGIVYYEIEVENSIYQFGINTMEDEWKTTYLYPTFKSIILMRWIRKSIKDGTFIQIK
ncbi:MAG: hypothetical protein PHF86_01240 [Candidatus Nanoarchaeia archaeon]|nr:hypothetical protein [Candidatus Nanoarchaeia archaeon]